MEFCHKLHLILILLGLSSVWAISYTNTGCPSFLQFSTSLKTFQGLCYQFVPVENDWYNARDYCQKYGGQLVSIPDSKTNDFLKHAINSMWWRNNGIWIGLNDLDEDGQFTWTSKSGGTRLGSWINWGSGHPGAFLSSHRDCIRMARDGGLWKWHETPCSFPGYKYRFICQYETVKPVYTSTTVTVISSPQTAKPSLQTIPSVITPDYVTDVHYEEPIAFLQQRQNLIKESNIVNNDSDSKATQVALVCLACLLIIALSAAVFIYRRRHRQLSDADSERSFVKNGHLENARAAKVENIYIDESMQKFLKSKEGEKQEGIYEEIPYDADNAEVVHV